MDQWKLDLGLEEQPISTLLACEEPVARIESVGAAALSDTELLALVLGVGLAPAEAMSMARKIVRGAGSLRNIASWTVSEFRDCQGVGPAKARQLVGTVELARRMMAPPSEAAMSFNRPEMVLAYFTPIVHGLEIEKFWVLCLNRKNRLKKLVEITSGTATSSLAHPREVFRAAIREGASAVVCVHNHPSGDPAPSAADVQVTRQLRDAAKTVDIELLDHVVVGNAASDPNAKGYYSFREACVL